MKTIGVLLGVSVFALGCVAEPAVIEDDEEEGPGGKGDLPWRSGTLDHAGIVEVTTIMLASVPVDPILDPFNEQDPFLIRRVQFASTFARRLAAFDAADGRTDWTGDQAASWVNRISTGNYLIVDTSKPCDFFDPQTYLEIERAKLLGFPHETCGGRMPNEDALDVTMNFLTRGPAASVHDTGAIRDGVDHATQSSEARFPYLAEMN
jgi:hypothetical protein